MFQCQHGPDLLSDFIWSPRLLCSTNKEHWGSGLGAAVGET